MQPETAEFLIKLNLQFYQSFADQFSATRGRVNPGVARILDQTSLDAKILDLGCGNGSVALDLQECGFKGEYLGVDFSEGLLSAASNKVGENPHFRFEIADLTDLSNFKSQFSNFDLVFSFAAMHHIPGKERRISFLNAVNQLLKPGGRFIHSNWQFLNSSKLAARVQDWARVDLGAEDVDADDYLLDWKSGGEGLRYVHHYNEKELAGLAAETGFTVEETFLSDGKEGNLGLYGVWGKAGV